MDVCDVCDREQEDDSLREVWRLVCRQTHWSPAEYDRLLVCDGCYAQPEPERDEAYERAAARYDGEGKDWR